MAEYDNLEKSYIAMIQSGLKANVKNDEAKHGNNLLYKFCENCVGNSNYSEQDKQSMSHDLELLKETFFNEIELRFH